MRKTTTIVRIESLQEKFAGPTAQRRVRVSETSFVVRGTSSGGPAGVALPPWGLLVAPWRLTGATLPVLPRVLKSVKTNWNGHRCPLICYDSAQILALLINKITTASQRSTPNHKHPRNLTKITTRITKIQGK